MCFLMPDVLLLGFPVSLALVVRPSSIFLQAVVTVLILHIGYMNSVIPVPQSDKSCTQADFQKVSFLV